MWPISAEVPKGLLPVAGVPFVGYQLRRLAAAGVSEVFLAVGRHLLGVWERFVAEPGDGPSLRLAVEDQPLDTAGPVRALIDHLDEEFFVLNGDVVVETDLSALAAAAPSAAAATIGLVEVEDTAAYGVVVVGDDGMVERFVEKPDPGEAPASTVNAGIYLMTRDALAEHPEGPLSFEEVVFPALARRGALGGVTVSGRWLDIGTPELYLDCHREVLTGGTSLHRLETPVMVEAGSSVLGEVGGRWAWVGAGATVARGALVEEAVVMPGASLEEGAVVRRAVIGWDATIGREAMITGYSMVGSRAIIGAGCELDAGIRVAPGAVLGEGAVTFTPPD